MFNIKVIHFEHFLTLSMLNLLFLLDMLLNVSVIFSDLMLPNEMSGYTENISTLIFFIHLLVLSSYLKAPAYTYEPGHMKS